VKSLSMMIAVIAGIVTVFMGTDLPASSWGGPRAKVRLAGAQLDPEKDPTAISSAQLKEREVSCCGCTAQTRLQPGGFGLGNCGKVYSTARACRAVFPEQAAIPG
jgi:hypothetical protein